MNRRKYLAYLLRLWQENPQKPWRATLVSPDTGEKVSFAETSSLIAFLEEKIGGPIVVRPENKGEKS